MAADSPVKACIDLYESLSAAAFPLSTRPTIWFDEAPTYDGGQVRPSYVVIKDGGVNTESTCDMEANVIDTGDVTLEIYADTLANADAIAKAIRWNGSAPSARLGFDFGVLTYNSPFIHLQLHRKTEQRFVAGIGHNGQRTHGHRMTYGIMSGVQA